MWNDELRYAQDRFPDVVSNDTIPESPQSAEIDVCGQPVANIEAQLEQLTADFTQLDALKAELLTACQQIVA